jgi:2-polyprenyl-3-methyl-5-hydroxy-6-metoxy-1,4-benzoquinol methylase
MPSICWCGNHKLEKYSDTYSKCTVCNTLISDWEINNNIYQVSNEEEDFYGKNYWIEDMTSMANVDNIDQVIDLYLKERSIYWLKFILKYKLPEAKVAEIGCGLGQFSYLLKNIGYDQVAFELSHEICEFIKDKLGINIQNGEFKTNDIKYDVIIAMDVIEHILEPKKIMKEISSGLSNNGILILQAPCYDQTLEYKDMLCKKERFKDHLKPEQHVYLYSKDSISELLNEYGFKYINFEEPVFGSDYDMFIFASKEPFNINGSDAINQVLDQEKNGRMIKALLNLYDDKDELLKKVDVIDNDRQARLEGLHLLNSKLQESEKDREARLETIQNLDKRLQESEKDREARLETIQNLDKRLQESEKDREARLETIQNLDKRLQESEKDREARLETIQNLDKRLQESEKDRAARLEVIESLSKKLLDIEQIINSKKGFISKSKLLKVLNQIEDK